MPFIDANKHDTLTSVRSKTFIYINHFFGIISEYILHIIYIISKQRYEYSYLVKYTDNMIIDAVSTLIFFDYDQCMR